MRFLEASEELKKKKKLSFIGVGLYYVLFMQEFKSSFVIRQSEH